MGGANNMHQLELAISQAGTLVEALTWTIEHRDCAAATKAQHGDHRRWLLDYFSREFNVPVDKVRIESIGFPQVLKYIADEGPEGRGLDKITVKKRLITLRMALEDCYRRGLLAKTIDWWPDIEAPGKPGQDLWTYEQYRQGRLAFEPGQRIGIDILFWTGMHSSNVLGWRRHDVDLVGKRWRRYNTKSKAEPAWLPLPDEFAKILDDWFAQEGIWAPTLKVAPQWWASPIKPMARVCHRAGVPRVTQLGLRRACVSYQFELGAKKNMDMKRLAEWVAFWLGHKGDPATSSIIRRHYLRWTPEAIRAGSPF